MFAQDQSDTQIQLGVTSSGLVVFQNNVRINTFSWSKIVKISFKRKQFFIQLRKESVRVTCLPLPAISYLLRCMFCVGLYNIL